MQLPKAARFSHKNGRLPKFTAANQVTQLPWMGQLIQSVIFLEK